MGLVITLSSIGNDVTGPFDLFSNIDNFINAFASDISLSELTNGYPVSNVPDNTSVIRVFDKSNKCLSFIDTSIGTPIIIEP